MDTAQERKPGLSCLRFSSDSSLQIDSHSQRMADHSPQKIIQTVFGDRGTKPNRQDKRHSGLRSNASQEKSGPKRSNYSRTRNLEDSWECRSSFSTLHAHTCRTPARFSGHFQRFEGRVSIREHVSRRYFSVSGIRTRIASSTRTINSENFCLPTLRMA